MVIGKIGQTVTGRYTGSMETRETLGQRLQRLRVQAGLTQAQVAAAAQVPLPSLRNWETDRREPGFRAACRLAKALRVPVEVLAETTPIYQTGKIPRPAGPTKSITLPKLRPSPFRNRRR